MKKKPDTEKALNARGKAKEMHIRQYVYVAISEVSHRGDNICIFIKIMLISKLECLYRGFKAMRNKATQLLAYIAKNYAPATVTSLMKLVYLIDLVAITKGKKQISDFTYKRYRYGPFDPKIYTYLNELVNNKILLDITENTPMGEEYIKYKFNEENEKAKFDKLSDNELETIDEVIESVRGYGVKTVTEITYKTKPMLALGATIGGEENLNVRLDLNAK